MTKFDLSKWYLDCVSRTGDVVVVYFAEVRWGGIRLPYASALFRPTGGAPTFRSAGRGSLPPKQTGSTLSWSAPTLGVAGCWESLAEPISMAVFESAEGRVEWHCHQPRSRARVTVDGRSVTGLGYAEHVRMTIAPWRLPIEELRWGRFVGDRHGLLWIDWRGPQSKRVVLLDGADVRAARIDGTGVASECDGVRLTIGRGEVLRSGAIGSTALASLPGRHRLPLRILAVDETKWCATGALDCADGPDEGWVIHEVVRWPVPADADAGEGRTGKLLYGVLFAGVLPVLLILWAHATEGAVHASSWHSVPAGLALAVAGIALMLAGWASLWWHGGGLPMNAYPPPHHVTRGAYAILAHPIYVGFAAVCFGLSIAAGSASGQWLVSPFVALASIALVAGYERSDLEVRFPRARVSPWLGLPSGDGASPSLANRISAAVLGVGPWLMASALHAHVLDAGVFLLALGAPVAVRRRTELRRLMVHALIALSLLAPLPLLLPGVVPSYRTFLALLAADACASLTPRARFAWLVLALAVAARDLTPSGAGVCSVLVSVGTFALVIQGDFVWRVVKNGTERLANSWWEFRIGPLRVINHGLWAALGTAGGVAIVGTLVGPGHLRMVIGAALAALVSSALWAQWVEGSSLLLRPFGFYGGLLGVCAAAFVGPLLGTPPWLLLGAYAVAGPYVQAMGRLRCLVQGCCHGRATSSEIGIRYRHPRSRVCRLAGMRNRPVHATPLYSILCNALTALVLVRLWTLHAALALVCGVYLMMNGLGRFVEEAYRGEPQTPIVARLRLYQWFAIGTAVAGALVTALGAAENAPYAAPNRASVWAGVLFGLFTWVAMGVDLPESNRRFSRLS